MNNAILNKMKKLIITFLILLAFVSIKAQILKPVKWSYAAKTMSNGEASVFLKAIIDDGWHIYSTKQKDGGPVKTLFSFGKSPEYFLIGKLIEPPSMTRFEKTFDMDVQYFERSVVFQQKIKIKSSPTTVKGKLEFMVCNREKCLPPEEIEFSIPVK